MRDIDVYIHVQRFTYLLWESMACVSMNSIEDLLAEIIRLKKLLSEKDEALEKMNYEISALVKFIVSKNKFSNSIVNVDVVPNFTQDGQDVVKRSKF